MENDPELRDGEEDPGAQGGGGADEGGLAALTPAMVRRIELWPLDKLEPYERNARTHSPEQVQVIAASILEFGFVNPILVAHGRIRAGHGRLAAAELLGLTELPVVELDHLTEIQARAFTLADNRIAEMAGWDEELLAVELQELTEAGAELAATGFSDAELAQLAADLESGTLGADPAPPGRPGPTPEDARGILAQRFGVPPFSVLDAKAGYWQERKAAWLALGIRSEVGREGNLLGMSATVLGGSSPAGIEPGEGGRFTIDAGAYEGGNAMAGGTSVFDPVLCELAYRWWCPEGGRILDPFAGGSVRGIVAARLGFTYCGFELREEQVAANREQAERILGAGWELKCQWIHGDASSMATELAGADPFHFLFTCPPYYDLERYSDDPRDLSAMGTYPEFIEALRGILAAAVGLLEPHAYACVVVSDLRDGEGCYRGLERDTQLAMEAAGAATYNLAVLAQPVGSLPIRAGRIFGAGRKLPRNHQAVQVFAKGQPWRELREALGPTGWESVGEAAGEQAVAAGALPLEALVVEELPAFEPEAAAPAGDTVTLMVSAKQARQRFHGCDPKYIAEVCHASCCRSSRSPHGTLVAALPSEQPGLAELGAEFEGGLILPREGEKQCRFETPEHLCELHGSELKPSGCIASPFTLSPGKRPKLVVANRYRLLRCYKDDRDGEPPEAYRAFRASLDLLLGEPEAARLCAHLDEGGGDLEVTMDRARFEGLRFKAAVSRAGKRPAKAAK